MKARRVGAMASFAVLVLFVAAPHASADSFTLTSSGGNWSNTAIWQQNGLPATRTPGSLAGTLDTVALATSLYTVTLDTSTIESVLLTTTCTTFGNCVLDVASANTLKLSAGSTIGSNVNLKITGGTLDGGTLTVSSGAVVDWSSGTIQNGTLTVGFGAQVNAAGPGTMTLSGETATLNGYWYYSAGQQAFNDATTFTVGSGGNYELIESNGIFSNDSANSSITVNAGGVFQKTGGNYGTNIDPTLNNHGTVTVSVSVLAINNGTHDGTFNMTASGTGVSFNGTETFDEGLILQGAGRADLFDTITINGVVTATNLYIDRYGSLRGGTSGVLNVSGLFETHGGSFVNGLTVNNNGTFDIAGDANTGFNTNAIFNNNGTVTINLLAAGNNVEIDSGAVFNNAAGKTVTLTGDVAFLSDGTGGARIANAGTFTKSSGSQIATVDVEFNNTGSVSVINASGGLAFSRGGTHSASSFLVGTGCAVGFSGGTHSFDNVTISGSTGLAKFTGGTATVGLGGLTIGAQTLQSGGTIGGSGTLSINNKFTWSSGTQSGSGKTILDTSAHTFSAADGPLTLTGRQIENNGTLTYAPGGANLLSINSGGQLINKNIFNLSGDVTITSDGVSIPLIDNRASGTLEKNSGSGTAHIYAAVDNAGSVNIPSGQLAFNGGGTNTGTINIPAAANALRFEFGTYTLDAGTVTGINDLGSFQIAGGTVDIGSPLTLKNVELSGGTLDGDVLDISGKLTWTGGSIAGASTTNILLGATLDHTAPTTTTTLQYRTLHNYGTFNYAPGLQGLMLDGNATISNESGGVFDIKGDGALLNGGGTNTFSNLSGATLKRTAGTSSTGMRFDVPVNNSGTISNEAGGGSIIFAGGGATTGGTISTATSSDLIDFFSGTFSVSMTGNAFTGPGSVEVVGGTLQVTANANANTTLSVKSGTLTVTSPNTFQISTLNWQGGTIGGSGTKRVFAGFIDNTAPTTLAGGTLTFAGSSMNYSGDSTNFLTVNGGATFNVETGATLNLTSAGTLGGTGTLSGSGGTIVKISSGTMHVDTPVSIATGGTIGATGGILQLDGGGTISRPIDTGVSAMVDFSGGTFNLSSGSILGSGSLRISGATVNANANVTAPKLLLTAGSLAGSGAVSVDGGTWSGGDLDGSATFTVNGGKTFDLESNLTTKMLRRPFTNNGTLRVITSATTVTLDGATLTNNGTMDLQQPIDFAWTGAAGSLVVNNGGTMQQSGINSGTFLHAPFNNNGTVTISNGNFDLLGSGTHSGSFTVGTSCVLGIDGTSQALGVLSSVSGAGHVVMGATAATVDGAFNLGGKLFLSGSGTFNSASGATAGALILSGTLTGSANLTLTSSIVSSWDGGTMSGSGTTFVNGSGIDVTGNNGPMYLARDLEIGNSSTMLWNSLNGLALENGVTLTNNGTLSLLKPGPIQQGTGGGSVVNNGTTTRNSFGGTLPFAPPFTNNGTVQLVSGNISFDGGYTQDAGSTDVGAATTLSSPLTIPLNGGVLQGSGIVDANVSNSGGNVKPGTSPGLLTINGNYAQGTGGTLTVELGGTIAGTDYDRLAVTGSATLGGALVASFVNSFTPSNGNIFDVLTYSSATGTFNSETLPTFPGGGTMTSSYRPTSYRLTANSTATPTGADMQVVQSPPPPSSVAHGQNVTFTFNVTNNGPSTATNVSFSDTLSGAQLVSATSTAGTCSGTAPIVCAIGTLSSGQGAVITITANANSTGSISNAASVSASETDPNTANNNTSAALTTTVNASADLGVTVTDSPDPAASGATVTYSVVLSNGGPDAAANTLLSFSMSNGSITSVSSASLTCSGSGASASCSAASLPTGSYGITVTAQAGSGLMTLTAGASSSTSDPSSGNNTASAQTTITSAATSADLGVTLTDSPDPVASGATVTYSVALTNGGPDAAANTLLSFSISNGSITGVTSGSLTCSGSGASASCSAASLPTGSYNITVTAQAGSGVMTLTAGASSSTADPSTGNNTASAQTTITSTATSADLGVTLTDSPDPATSGTTVTYNVVLTNGGPDAAANAVLSFSISNGSITSVTSASLTCNGSGASASCSAASLPTGSYNITVTAQAGSGVMTLTASASSSTGDPSNANNTASAQTTITSASADVKVLKSGPASAEALDNVVYTITVHNLGAGSASNVVVSDPTPSGLQFVSNVGACANAFPCNLGTLAAGQSVTITSTYQVMREARGTTITNTASVTSANDTNPANDNASAVTAINCSNNAPSIVTPANGTTEVPTSGFLRWSVAGADRYVVYLGPAGSGCTTAIGVVTDGEAFAYSGLAGGTTYEWRVEGQVNNCPVASSSCATFTTAKGCSAPAAPLPSVVGQTTSAKTYSVTWDAVPGAARYEIDEATNADFAGATTISTTKTEQAYKHDVDATSAFYYRVRAFNECAPAGVSSPTVRVVIVPVEPVQQTEPPSATVPAGSTEVVVQQVFIPGRENETLFYSATTDRPWLSVRPDSGVLPPEGITLDVVADPRNLPNGTFTASVIVTLNTSSASRVTTNAVTYVTVPVSVNLVTPVTPVQSKPSTSPYALVIPSVGHLDGIDSHWQSDVRVTNAGFRSARYGLTFTPTGGTASGVKQTVITVDAGATTALDDIIRNWYGVGAFGDGANGMLEIVPLEDPQSTALVTVASSRTYNVTGNGTLGQYIPALPFSGFVGRALNGALPNILSLQQIAQSKSFRTNVGIAEASGNAVSVLVSVFDDAAKKVLELPLQLGAGEQRQLNGLLAENGIELEDGRVEVQVTGGDGKVTAYASVVDNHTGDPLLVSGAPLAAASGSTRYVLPGAANLDNSVAHWRTDMRVFNYAPSQQAATLTFFPLGGGAPKNASVTLNAGQVLKLDNVIRTLFGSENTGGVVHLNTEVPSSLVVTGRTYNDTESGTFGQFIPAVTPQQATGLGGRTLHILQVEDSSRYRTNIGLAEVSGKPVTVELQIVLPDSKITPTVQIDLQPNEFRQFAVIRDLGLGNVYNARVTLRVVGGAGRVTAYGSVIDELTQDPTYVPAQ
ncbi:MAG TPA: hypothetical protein VF824_20320 [Thermoanaerobaculia bacterium]|jgi:uncharacterized repeat protein (TIGR01451 family)